MPLKKSLSMEEATAAKPSVVKVVSFELLVKPKITTIKPTYFIDDESYIFAKKYFNGIACGVQKHRYVSFYA